MPRAPSAIHRTRHDGRAHRSHSACVVSLALGLTLCATAACGRSRRVIGGGFAASAASGGNNGEGAAGGASGTPGSAGASDTPTDAERLDACLGFVRTVCNKVFFECNGAEDSADPCPPATDSTCPDRYFSPGSTTSVAELERCARIWAQASCDDIRQGTRPDCLPRGEIASGGACVFGAECASGYCAASTNPDGSPGCGVCVPLVFLGDDCTSSSVRCYEGLVCQDGRCVAAPAYGLPAGATCDRWGSCASGFYCLELPGSDGPRCVAAPAVGDECPLDTPYCEGNCAEGVCVAAPRFGAPCALGGDDAHVCERELRCDLTAAGGPVCTRPLSLGDACKPLNADFSAGGCESGALCHCNDTDCAAGTCVKRRDVGESCDGAHDVCIAGTECDGATCVASGSQGLVARWCGP